MKRVTSLITERNPVWVVPLALPIVLYAGQSLERALLFAGIVTVVLPSVHVISYFAESLLPRTLRIIPVLAVAGTVVTIVELFVLRAGVPATDRLVLIMRATSVSGIVIWPTIRAQEGERFVDRLEIVVGLLLGFLLGFTVFTAIRLVARNAGFGLANSVAFGFFILAIGRMGITARKRQTSRGGDR